MAETTPHLAPIVVLLFLGAVFLTGVSLLLLLYGAARRSKRYARIGGGSALAVVACYALLLCGVSLASSETRRTAVKNVSLSSVIRSFASAGMTCR